MHDARRPEATPRRQEVAFAHRQARPLDSYFRRRRRRPSGPGCSRSSSTITRRWLDECVDLQGRHLPAAAAARPRQRTRPPRRSTSAISSRHRRRAAARCRSCGRTTRSARPATSLSTPARPSTTTDADKCHVNHVVARQRLGGEAGADPRRRCTRSSAYVKNQNLGFTIPYTLEGEHANYIPDFLVRLDDGHGDDDLLNLIVEVTGETKKDKAAKVETARNLWVPAVNNHGGFGRWAFLEITDPWDAEQPDPRRRSRSRCAKADDVTMATQQEDATTDSADPVEAITHTGQADEHPDRRAARRSSPTTSSGRRRCATRATRRSTRSSSGRARTSRTADDLGCRRVPIYIQEKIDPQALIENLRATREGRRPEPELDLVRRLRRPDVRGDASTSTTTPATGRTG